MNIVLILSGGIGSRISSDIPKQYIPVNGKMIITRCIEAVLHCSLVDGLFIVADDSRREMILNEAQSVVGSGFTEKFIGFAEPGKNRQLSVLNGLRSIVSFTDCTKEDNKEDIEGEIPENTEKYIKEYNENDIKLDAQQVGRIRKKARDIVIVHDAARPLVSADTIRACIETCSDHDGAMPALPMKDTVYLSDDGRKISSLLDRKKIFAGQAPEAFLLRQYLEANEALLPDRILNINGASEPALLAGMDIAIIPGDENNFKITTDHDLERFIEIVERVETGIAEGRRIRK